MVALARVTLSYSRCAVLACAFVLARHAAAADVPDPGRAPDAARDWFQDAKFGLFIHWGVYSVLGDGEWVMNNQEISSAEYEKLPPKFNPTEFDAVEWVSIAKRAGQRYITITSKHHDGFCMWDTKQGRYDIVDGTPYGKDVLKMLSDECRKQGIKLFFYHSHLDWHHPDYYPRGRTGQHSGRPDQGDWKRYLDYLNAQLAELCSPPYQAAGIWFDGWWDRPDADWQLAKTYGIIHRLRPEALIGNNHHVEPFAGEDFQMFEQDLPGRNSAGFNRAGVSVLPLETCRTMNNSWGYNEKDKGYRPLPQQIRFLIESVGLGANLLLNVGPMPNGKIPPEAVELLLGMGRWLEANGEAVYGTRPGPWSPSRWGYAVHRGARAYFHLLEWPSAGVLVLPAFEGVKGASLLGGAALALERDGESLRVRIPGGARDPLDTILVFECSGDLAGKWLAVPPPRIEVAGDEVELKSKDAETTGKIQYEGGSKDALGSWSDIQDHVVFHIEAPEEANYEVELIYSCAAGSEGSELEVSCGGSRLRGWIVPSGDADRFTAVPLGALALPRGPSDIVLRAVSKPDKSSGVMNLRGLALRKGYRSLFNGKDLAGWRGAVQGYGSDNGMLFCRKESGGNLYTDREFADFDFRFEFRLYPGSNNGVAIRTLPEGDGYTGMEIQILDDGHEMYKDIEPWQAHGSIYHVVPAKRGHLRPAGQWNVEEITCRGRKVTVRLNGVTIVDANLDDVKDAAPPEKRPGLARTRGHIGFLGHGSRVDFRNLRIKSLSQ